MQYGIQNIPYDFVRHVFLGKQSNYQFFEIYS